MQWYEELFKNYANKYENESFTTGTIGEVDFIEHEIQHNKTLKILDIGCGTGRHSIELAKRGYDVTGIDLSESMLAKARLNAADQNVKVNFMLGDARNLPFENNFELAIMICEGGFPLMETDELNFMILQSARKAIKEGGKLIFTTLNGLFPLFNSVQEFINQNSTGGINKANSFDLMTFRDYNEYEIVNDSGETLLLKCNERYYVPSEITWLLKSVGFKNIEILGCEIGKWQPKRELTSSDYEMLVITSL
jgi:SAM-dependent methyltransferase